MGQLYNRQREEEKRRALRRAAPPAEVLFWQQVRDRRLGGFKFHRQFSIKQYVADFYCAECRLIIELDGDSHTSDDAVEYDLNRQNYFESLGFAVVRFTNQQIYQEMSFVLENLTAICEVRRGLNPLAGAILPTNDDSPD